MLTECFKNWASLTDDQDIVNKYKVLKNNIPFLDEEVYYSNEMEQIEDCNEHLNVKLRGSHVNLPQN